MHPLRIHEQALEGLKPLGDPGGRAFPLPDELLEAILFFLQRSELLLEFRTVSEQLNELVAAGPSDKEPALVGADDEGDDA